MRGKNRPAGCSVRGLKVLVYHRIVDDEAVSRKFWHCLHVERFRRQLELLDRWGFTPITFADYRLFREGELNLPSKPVIITFDDGYMDTFTYAFPLLQEFGMRAVVFVLGDRRIKTNYWDRTVGFPEAPLMDGRHILELHEAGFEIGAHSMSHVKLTAIREDLAWDEISRSRMLLEILLNDNVHTFSYPYGLNSAGTRRMTQNAGYLSACSVGSGPAVFGQDPFEIRRLTVFNNAGAGAFALRLLAPYEYYGWLRWRVSRYLKTGDPGHTEFQHILDEKKRRHSRDLEPLNKLRERAHDER